MFSSIDYANVIYVYQSTGKATDLAFSDLLSECDVQSTAVHNFSLENTLELRMRFCLNRLLLFESHNKNIFSAIDFLNPGQICVRRQRSLLYNLKSAMSSFHPKNSVKLHA